MLQTLIRGANQLLSDLNRTFLHERNGHAPLRTTPPSAPVDFLPVQHIILTDGVARTLFEEFAAHRAEERGEEETGWVLMGQREQAHAVVLATLPAGAERDASVSHVRFNSMAQALASRIVRQSDKRLTILGVVHTHPGSLRHPSDADYRGDIQWIRNLRGRQGMFAIGTADGRAVEDTVVAHQPQPHVQCLGELCFTWYTLKEGDTNYHPLPIELTLGPDLARPLHDVWSSIEQHAERLDRLYRQQAGVTFEVTVEEDGPALVINIPLAEPRTGLRVTLREDQVRYYLKRGEELLVSECCEERVDRGVYLLLAELAD